MKRPKGKQWPKPPDGCRKTQRREAVTHPEHYGGDTPYEVYKVLEIWGLVANAYLWNAIKYIARAGKKHDYVEDLRKAQRYLDFEITRHEKSRTAKTRSNKNNVG